MKLLTKALEKKLVANWTENQATTGAIDFKPVVKFFGGAATWLITEFDGKDTFFGLCDLGLGFPEIGYVAKTELEGVKFQFGLGIERDLYFKADKTVGEYLKEAKGERRVYA